MTPEEMKDHVEKRTGVTEELMPEEGIEVPKTIYLECLVSARDQLRVQVLENDDVEFSFLSGGRWIHSIIMNKESAQDLLITMGLWGFKVPTE